MSQRARPRRLVGMQPRIKSPVFIVPGARDALRSLHDGALKSGIPHATFEMVNLRASQINGCSVCVDMHSRALRKLGEKPERIFTVAAWREAPYFSDAERAALDLAECTTRLCDRADAVPDAVWNEAARHYDEPQLAALVMAIATINVWNRVNAATHQITGEFVEQYI
jgi:AhpD family alkylhydroperoxidase